jgi:hypothetical protein
LYLPPNLGPLAKVTSKDSGRYALNNLRVIDPGDGTFRAEATDGRRLLIVRGPVAAPADYPPIDEHPNGVDEILVPAPLWLEAAKLANQKPRHAPSRWEPHPIGLAMNEESGLLVAYGSGIHQINVPKEDGRFPDVNQVIPPKPAFTEAKFDPKYLASLCLAMGELGCESVVFLFYGKDKPVGLMGRNELGQYLDALLMPIS